MMDDAPAPNPPGAYENWRLEEAALDAALTNVALRALQATNRGGTSGLVAIAGTHPPQYVVIGTLEGIAVLIAPGLADQARPDQP